MKIEHTKKQFYVLKYFVTASIMVRAAQICYLSPEPSGEPESNKSVREIFDRNVLGSFK